MYNDESIPKLIVIVGATATGKSALAIDLAERFGGEILCADSRTVYRGMDIGTAKPNAEEQNRVLHWGLDLVEPDQSFTAADFKTYAMRTIADIAGRGKVPIMVGGSGLYIDGVLYDYAFRPAADPKLRAELEARNIESLQAKIRQMGLQLPENDRNARYLMRTIESGGSGGDADRQKGIRANTLVLGLDMPNEVLDERIRIRVEDMVERGLVDEVRRLGERFGWSVQALQAPGYRAFRQYIDGTKTLDEATFDFVKNDRALARRQKTWFKRNKSIQWLLTEDKMANAVDLTTTYLDT